MPGNIRQFGQLRHKNKDGQGVYKTGYHRARDEPHQAAELKVASGNLKNTGQQRRSKEILETMLFNQCHHQQGHGASGCRNHAGTATHEGNDHRNTKRGVKTHFGIDTGNDREGNGLRDQCQRHDDTGEHIATNVRKPVGF